MYYTTGLASQSMQRPIGSIGAIGVQETGNHLHPQNSKSFAACLLSVAEGGALRVRKY